MNPLPARIDDTKVQVALRLRILELNVEMLARDVEELHTASVLNDIAPERFRLQRLYTNIQVLAECLGPRFGALSTAQPEPAPVRSTPSVPQQPSAWQLARWKAPVGEIFGLWEVIAMAEPQGSKERWLCRCLLCKQEYIRGAGAIRHRNTRCCITCYRKHGRAKIRELVAKQRAL